MRSPVSDPMSLHRFLLPDNLDITRQHLDVALDARVAHHLEVLRISPGEHIVLADPAHTAIEVIVDSIADGRLSCDLVRVLPEQDRFDVRLYQGISRGERMDLVFRACTELGVAAIVPVMMSRCVVRLDEAKARSKVARWRRIAMSAAEQAGRVSAPEVPEVMGFEEAVIDAGGCDAIVVPYEEQDSGSIRSALAGLPGDARVALFIGPEGGFEESEVEALLAAGAEVVTLGPTILRTETAGIVASTLVLSQLGALGMGT